MSRRLWLLPGALALATVFMVVSAAGAQGPPGGQDPAGSGSKAESAAEEPFETGRYLVRFDERATLTPAVSRDWDERGQLVVDSLKRTAATAQARAVELVEVSAGATYESHWISNTLVVDGSPELIEDLRALSGVAEVRPEVARPIQSPVQTQPATAEAMVEAPWGIEKIRAPEAWADGVLGGGVVVASLDSGVQYDHPALVEKYRGNLGGGSFDHNYNWFDASRTCADPAVPCDDYGHGTHTMGTMVGGDGPGPFTPDVGVAPGAQWITVSCGPFFCTEGQLMEAAEWLLAPTDLNGENPDPSRRPDIVNNSWGGGPGDPFFLDFVRAWRAAGVVPVFAAGNPGPSCGAGGSPGDYLEAFSVGATDADDVIADFSGRGPSGLGKVNPNVSAPGVFVLSSVPGNGYEYFDGTSMAAPHVVGSLALMMSADPDLRGDVDAVTALLASTAVDRIDETCGGDADGDPNNVYGEGRIDAAAAVSVVATGGTLTGTVTNSSTGAPLAGAQISATSATWESRTFTGSDGRYTLFLPADTYVVLAESFGFEARVAPGLVVAADVTATQDLSLEPLPVRTVRGVVRAAEQNRPIAGALVEAVGVPVDGVKTDSRGRYSLDLPVGTYTMRASQGGCRAPETADVELSRNRTVNLRLATRIDDWGHGCAPLAFDWIEAETQSGVYGDDLAGRLDLPFEFPFYDQSYQRVYLATNGYLNFIDEFGFSSSFNSALPSEGSPNAAIYALWQDLIVDDQSRIDYDTATVDGKQVFVIEWEGVAQLGTDNRLDMEVKLWEDGTIDLLYGDGIDQLGGGSAATVGLENADATDAFQFSFREAPLEPNTAWRFQRVPTGIATGTVTNANDGLPVAGATVTSDPGERSTVTDENGAYRLRLVPGRYELTTSAPNYTDAAARVRIRDEQQTDHDFALDAASAAIAPLEVSASVALGETSDVTLTVSNRGRAPLDWALKEREESATPPGGEPPPPETASADLRSFRRNAEWARPDIGAMADLTPDSAGTLFDGPLDIVVDDPVDDAQGAVDVDNILGGTDGVDASFRIDYSAGTPMGELAGYLFLDTDQDPTTGLPAEALDGLPGQDVGMEYFVDLFGASFGEVLIIDAATFELVAVLPTNISGQSLSFDLPLDALGGDDGAINLASVVGDFNGPSDWAPDEGHGELSLFRDTDWMTPVPDRGTAEAGGSTEVTLTLGGADLGPGNYRGSLTLVSNDPRQPRIPVSVSLDVAVPADFGTVVGRVTKAGTSEPLAAEMTLTAERNGAPYTSTAATDGDGDYRLFGPEGTWPVTVVAEGFLAFEGEVTINAGGETTLDVALGPDGPRIFISGVEGGCCDVELPPDDRSSRTLNIANTGTEDVTFEIFEESATVPDDAPTPTAVEGDRYRWDPDEGRGRITAEDVPWLTFGPDRGTIAPGTDTDVSVTVDAAGLEAGLYQAFLVVNSNDPGLPSFPVPVNLTVTPP